MLDYDTLKIIWWILVAVLLIGFALTDGHDMGGGILLPFLGKNDEERRTIINVFAPHWDGNQVWLVTGGAALFAAWPPVYAAAFSTFYLVLLATLWALLLRPGGFEYRSKLDNPGWMRPFQGLLALFAPPRYGNFDPTWTLATFFPLFFGIVVGDIAYGLIFLAFGLWLRRRGKNGKNLDLGPLGIVIPARNLPGIGTVINWAAAWTIVWGAVYGEFWGNFLEHWPHDRPIFYPGDKGIFEILLFRVEQFTPLLIITLGFGVLQVLLGWAIRAYYGWKHQDAKHLWEGIGMFSGLVGVVVFATAYLNGALGPAVLTVSGLLLAVFLLGVVLSGIPLMLVELISNSGNILSYLRLFAVGLSAALVANLGTDAGFAMNEAIAVPVLGEILGIVVAVVINLLAVILTLVGHTLQPLRLQYVEFFTKFGFYEESGRAYQPFRLHGGKA